LKKLSKADGDEEFDGDEDDENKAVADEVESNDELKDLIDAVGVIIICFGTDELDEVNESPLLFSLLFLVGFLHLTFFLNLSLPENSSAGVCVFSCN